MRIGIGYDVHALKVGRELWLGGVLVPHEKGLDGHSDADVLIHSICDAILGALKLGDIGKLFPDSDQKYKNIRSTILLEKIGEILLEKGWEVQNIDSVIAIQKPKIAPYISSMCDCIAKSLKINTDLISVKATTTEYLGFEGRQEGVSAQAVVLLKKKNN